MVKLQVVQPSKLQDQTPYVNRAVISCKISGYVDSGEKIPAISFLHGCSHQNRVLVHVGSEVALPLGQAVKVRANGMKAAEVDQSHSCKTS